jgi:GNAT superfamily N-acetyltransferase
MSLPAPHIRMATLADATELARLRWDFSPDEVAASDQSFAEFQADFSDFWAKAIGSGNWAVWVAEQAGRLVCTIWLQVIHKVPRPGRIGGHKRYGYMTNVYTEPELRGQGIGSRVLKHAIQWAQDQELEGLVVWPSTESVSFYERAGFSQSPDALELQFVDGEAGGGKQHEVPL